MVKALLLVPVRDNDGKPFGRKDWMELEQQLIQFGGYTREANVTGAWQAGGKVYRDESRKYITDLDSWTKLAAWLEMVRWAKERFRQMEMYVEVADIPDRIR